MVEIWNEVDAFIADTEVVGGIEKSETDWELALGLTKLVEELVDETEDVWYDINDTSTNVGEVAEGSLTGCELFLGLTVGDSIDVAEEFDE